LTSDELADCRFQLQYRADYSARYHRRRAAFLSLIDQIFTLATLLAGATTFGQLVANAPNWLAKVGAAGVTLIALIQAVMRLGSAAEMHRQWLKRWNALASDLEAHASPSEAQVKQWLAERAAIESDCVAELRALAIDCENATSRFMQISGRQRKIRWWQRLIIQLGTLQQNFPHETGSELPPPHEQ
jgi:ABC-type multidrug transport system fused ATPase/permease subunit